MNIVHLELLLMTQLMILGMTDIISQMKRLRIRRWWTKPHILRQVRDEFGAYATIFMYFKLNDHEEFYEFTGMTVIEFSIILNLVADDLTSTSNRPGLSPELKLAAVLNFLRHGNNVRSHSWYFRIGRSTMYKLIATVTPLIYAKLADEYFKIPQSEDEWIQIAQDIYSLYGFPQCCGVLDGRHFRIRQPANSGALCYSWKKFYSIVLMALCDAHLRFIYASVGHRGGRNDSGIFNVCSLCQAIERGEIRLPRPSRLPNSRVVSPYTFIADGGFGLKKFVMTPYRNPEFKTLEQMIFEIRLTEVRKNVERAFGILVIRFQIFDARLSFSRATSQNIILCTMAIHNFLITSRLDAGGENAAQRDNPSSDFEESDDDSDDGLAFPNVADFSPQPVRGDAFVRRENVGVDDEIQIEEANLLDGDAIRDRLSIYFVTEGAVDWQWNKLP
ncbi:hypothetical protein QAD02_017497 [Eretmocerus hayati]|uniref:Uncharacterized protein n=1 Tax=Eretmocerus hayati TaxID=131215 RepID=A0ACC2PIU9_9HYME|nr:hypothetical protein QAD02_017497 [Eretmocerus hayati]